MRQRFSPPDCSQSAQTCIIIHQNLTQSAFKLANCSRKSSDDIKNSIARICEGEEELTAKEILIYLLQFTKIQYKNRGEEIDFRSKAPPQIQPSQTFVPQL
ncbi:hypothetical protein AAHA92_03515 [Salvia divinorum]|uniref:Uncharacterized protein n=1 Tax=Salvia divinorum TaxID=28513 RepID=A0ABD1IHC9_SALDI